MSDKACTQLLGYVRSLPLIMRATAFSFHDPLFLSEVYFEPVLKECGLT